MDIISELHSKIESSALWENQVSLKRNEYLVVKGNVEVNLFYIVSGALRIFVIDESNEQIIRFGYKNNFITALDSFITGRPTILYIQALKDTKLKSISKTTYSRLLNSTESNRKLYDEIQKQLIINQMEREVDILVTSPLERYKRVLKSSPQLFQEIPNKYIASYLRMTPETLSRLKKS